MFMKNSALLLLASFCFLCLTYKKQTANPTVDPPEEILQSAASFPIGAALGYNLLKDNVLYKEVVSREHNSVTVENAMKWGNIHPAPQTYRFEQADFIADFALARKKRIHGHTLVWYMSNPGWLKDFKGNANQWDSLMKAHIQTVVTHFKGKVAAWDVVNEAFRDDDGTLRVENRDTKPDKDNGCIWARNVGRDYLAKAFQYAHEADPNALLFYNEYGQEWSTKKTQSILAMVADFKQRNIPIHGLGLQMHIDINTSNDGIANAIRELTKTGLKIHMSELDISVNPKNEVNFVFTEELKQKQADKFKFVATTYKTLVPENQRYGITHWNVGDADSWIRSFMKRQDYPLLFDEAYQKKKAYFSFLEALK